MFTGIIQAIGTIEHLETRGGDCRLSIATGKLPLAGAALGDSIAVSGVCLTAIALGENQFSADVSRETLARTTLGGLKAGSRVNLELALTPATRLGGHIVSGHVDGVGEVVERKADARSVRFVIEAPANLAKYIAEKGSICVDGVSLTVNDVNGRRFDLNIVPHTLSETTLDEFQPGRKVNLEVDLLARYLERLLLGDKAAESGGVSAELLANSGFIKNL
ncbi:riboflavin synthase [Methylococcus sp. EFPC2]|uniref:riboflavin synthase n=1 Tax=Methylococcus sp. EFPC2 TaxID=2812648 RepID=UPI00196786C0|nr:riboflavin synthase [Methylococcus sp. EFPC2]QSA97682.1 riboflavin synthase [Methylococcus sp. EFPC2]